VRPAPTIQRSRSEEFPSSEVPLLPSVGLAISPARSHIEPLPEIRGFEDRAWRCPVSAWSLHRLDRRNSGINLLKYQSGRFDTLQRSGLAPQFSRSPVDSTLLAAGAPGRKKVQPMSHLELSLLHNCCIVWSVPVPAVVGGLSLFLRIPVLSSAGVRSCFSIISI